MTPTLSRGLRKAQLLPPPQHLILWLPRWDTLWYCVLPWHGWLHADATAIRIISGYCCDSLWTSLLRGKFGVFIRPWWFLRTQLGLGSLIPIAQTQECKCLAPVSEPYCQQRGAVFDFFFFNSSVDHVSRQQCAHSTRHRIWQAKQPASYLSLVQMTDFSVHRQFRIIWRFYFESNWRIFFSRTFSSPWYFTFLLQSLLNKTFYYLLKSAKNETEKRDASFDPKLFLLV